MSSDPNLACHFTPHNGFWPYFLNKPGRPCQGFPFYWLLFLLILHWVTMQIYCGQRKRECCGQIITLIIILIIMLIITDHYNFKRLYLQRYNTDQNTRSEWLPSTTSAVPNNIKTNVIPKKPVDVEISRGSILHEMCASKIIRNYTISVTSLYCWKGYFYESVKMQYIL